MVVNCKEHGCEMDFIDFDDEVLLDEEGEEVHINYMIFSCPICCNEICGSECRDECMVAYRYD